MSQLFPHLGPELIPVNKRSFTHTTAGVSSRDMSTILKAGVTYRLTARVVPEQEGVSTCSIYMFDYPSSANMVGANVVVNATGETLAYADVVPTGDTVLYARSTVGTTHPWSITVSAREYLGENSTPPILLEVEDDPSGLVNLISNPSGELGAWGWATPIAGSTMRVQRWASYGDLLTYTSAPNALGNWFYSDTFSVTPGNYVNAQWFVGTGGDNYRVRLDWLDANRSELSSSAWTSVTSAAGSSRSLNAPAVVPSGAAYGRIRFERGPVPLTSGGLTLSFRDVIVAAGPSANSVADVSDATPVTYRNILGPTHEISVSRDDLNVGVLTATVLDSTLDPSQSSLIRPGRRLRLMASGTANEDSPVFVGKIAEASVTYHLKDPDVPDSKRARILLTATDSISMLANQGRAQGVSTIDELPYVLEGCGVPWTVNGSGAQRSQATIVSRNDDASALDQVAISRDSAQGLAWMSRQGVLNVWERDVHDATFPVVATLDESAYSDLDLSFSTQDCINEVNVTFLRYNPITDQTTEVNYGPFRDQASINAWGAFSANFTVQGLTEDPAQIEAFAQGVLDANGTPALRINSVVLAYRQNVDWAFLDIGSRVDVVNDAAGLDQTSRIVGISHSITPEKWLITLTFAAPESVASPTFTPPVPAVGSSANGTGAMPVPIGGLMPYAGSAAPLGWLLCDGSSYAVADYPYLHAVIGYSFGGSGGTFNVPDLRNRTAVGVGSERALGSSDNLAEGSRTPAHSHGAGSLSTNNYSHNQLNDTQNGGTRARLTGPETHSHNVTGSTGNSGGWTGGNSGLPHLTVNYLIKV